MAKNDQPESSDGPVQGRDFLQIAVENVVEDRQKAADLIRALRSEFGDRITPADVQGRVLGIQRAIAKWILGVIGAGLLVALGVVLRQFVF